MKRRVFIKASGISGMALAGLPVLLSFSKSAPIIDEQLREQALQAFNRFESVWDFSDFWKRGNTFDACLVFAEAMNTQWPNDPQVREMNTKIVGMLTENLVFYDSVNFGVMWADDFGWWGLMAINARRFLLARNETELADKYWVLADERCWKHKKDIAYDYTADAIPVPHGCRNGDANGQSLGVKNTVTNVLLFLLSTRIYRLAKEEGRPDTNKYLEMAYKQYVWFTDWFKLEEHQFLKELTKKGALIQERPIAMIKDSGYTEKIHPPWAPGWVWTGDQGMLVAALNDMVLIKDDVALYLKSNGNLKNLSAKKIAKESKFHIKKIGNGVKNALVSTVDGIIREAPCLSSFGPVHGADYLAGRGIMMRYLGNAEEKKGIGVSLDKSVLKTVAAIWETRNKENNQFRPEYTTRENDGKYIQQFKDAWGTADDVYKWQLEPMNEKDKNAVCMAVGLDMIGAAIKTL